MTSWKEMILSHMKSFGEKWDDVVSCTLTEQQLEKNFDAESWSIQGEPFTLWSKTRVYFPVSYDGREAVDSVPRNPNGEATWHVSDGS